MTRKAANKQNAQDDSLSLESVRSDLGKENTYATITDSSKYYALKKF